MSRFNRGTEFFEQLDGYPDRHDPHIAQVFVHLDARHAGLEGGHRHGHIAQHGVSAECFACVRVEPAGEIDAEHTHPVLLSASIDPADQRCCNPFDRSAQARPEQCIDDQGWEYLGVLVEQFLGAADLDAHAFENGAIDRGIARAPLDRMRADRPDGDRRVVQVTREREAVTAVVARAAADPDAWVNLIAEHLEDMVTKTDRCVLHEHDRGDRVAFHGETIE